MTTQERPRAEANRPVIKTPIAVTTILMVLGRLVYLATGLAALFGLSYLFGHGLLEGVLGGNDTKWALSLVRWTNQWFPDLPAWYPLQGGGSPLLFFYPPGTSLLAVLVHRLAGVTEVQALALVGFLSVPITATGIYLLVWAKLRSQTMALIAGLLYPLSSASWYWLSIMGMYAQAVSVMYFPFAFLLFDAYITRALTGGKGPASVIDRLVLPAAALVFSITFLTHSATAFVLAMAVMLHAIVLAFLGAKRTDWSRRLLISVRAALTAIVAGLGMTAFWLIPFLGVMGLANREGLSEVAAHLIPYTDLASTLGLQETDLSPFSAGLTFSLLVLVLAGLGLIIALVRRSQALSWAALCVSFAVYTSMPGLWLGPVRMFEDLWALTQVRAFVPVMILLPALAAYGTGRFAQALVAILPAILRSLAPSLKPLLDGSRPLRGPLAGVAAAFTLAFFVTVAVGLEPPLSLGNRYSGYGPPTGKGRLPLAVEEGEIVIRDTPLYALTVENDPAAEETVRVLEDQLGLDATVRLDTSPYMSGLTQSLSLYTDASMINTYNYQSSIIHAMWGYQQARFYGETEADPEEINDLATWFGIQYVVLNRDWDSPEKYDPHLWPVAYPKPGDDQGIMEVRRFAEAPPLASLLRTPVVLVIGGYEQGAYEQAFRLFAKGALSYKDGLAVEGSHRIDDYSLEDLRLFDAVLLHGYGYGNRDRAWGLLDQYVREGGALYVDTGWQFQSPDWELDEAPEVLPIQSLTWTDLGLTDDFTIDDPDFEASSDALQFAPLIWEEQPWSLSSPSGGLREWARPVLSAAGSPLIAAGEYGDGRVVWSGMNLIGHATTYENSAERQFLRQLLGWLAPAPAESELTAPTVVRDHPDHIRFEIADPIEEGASLLWREAFSPDWRASVEIAGQRVNIPVYRAGPGLMLLRLPTIPESGAIIQMDFNLGWRGLAGTAISLATIAALLVSAAAPGLWSTIWARIRRRSTKSLPRGSVSWLPQSEARGGRDVAVGAVPHVSSTGAKAPIESATANLAPARSTEPPMSDDRLAPASRRTRLQKPQHRRPESRTDGLSNG